MTLYFSLLLYFINDGFDSFITESPSKNGLLFSIVRKGCYVKPDTNLSIYLHTRFAKMISIANNVFGSSGVAVMEELAVYGR